MEISKALIQYLEFNGFTGEEMEEVIIDYGVLHLGIMSCDTVYISEQIVKDWNKFRKVIKEDYL